MNAQKKWSDFETWITGEMLQGKRLTLTIKAVTIHEVHPRPGQTETGPALSFNETGNKRLYLSPTNRRTLGGLFGNEIKDCIGKRIALEGVPMRVAGRNTRPVRIGPATDKPAGSAPRQVDTATGEITADVAHVGNVEGDVADLDPVEEMISG